MPFLLLNQQRQSTEGTDNTDGCQALSIDPQGYYYYYVVVCLGGVFAGVVSDYLGGRALTCMMMLLFAAPSVNYSVSLLTNRNIF